MKKKYLLLFFVLFSIVSNAQITGKIVDKDKNSLPFVNVYLHDTYNGTTTNDEGNYSIHIKKAGNYTIVFQYLGFKTIKKEVEIIKLPYKLDITLLEDALSLNEVEINSKENPANKIIRNAIKNRKKNKLKMANFTADFYSRGIFRVKNAPEKIMGQDLGDLGGGLDTTRTGVLYLSETISKITKSTTKFKEKIIASKVSGDDSGFSFNQASDVNFSFYDNTVDLGDKIISPIATNAFNYYRYNLVHSFYEEAHLVNKIKISPKKTTDNAFNGFIYIVEDSWQIYGLEVAISGKQIQQPVIDSLKLKQNYTFSSKNKLWSLFSQNIDFKAGMFGFNMNGKFTAVYSDYNFQPNFRQKTFTKEVLSFEDNANKKDSLFWKKLRPVPLTLEEVKDYKLKDSIKVIRKSKKYLDSIDLRQNKFKITNLLFGYNYSNTYKKWNLNVGSPILNSMFNTVQGWHTNMNITFSKQYVENPLTDTGRKQKLWVNTIIDYGFSDEQLRLSGSIKYRFNHINRPQIVISGGRKITQFNEENPISNLVNAVSSLFFERNYAKFYDKTFADIAYSNEVVNGIRLNTSITYEDRNPLFNTTNYVLLNRDAVIYSSNNPLAENDYTNGAIEEHQIYRFKIGARINFGQEYISYPDNKQTLYNFKNPMLVLNYTKGFSASDSKYNYDLVQAHLYQHFDIANKGSFAYNFTVGKFLSTDELSFADYQHFNGNQTHVKLNQSYTGYYYLLPYYDLSTDKAFASLNAQHHFNGYLLRKIPLLNKLQWKTVIGGKTLLTTDNKPYSEVSIGFDNIGFGKFRFLRVDYVKSYFNGAYNDGFVFGIGF
ncbi:MAG: DUF5686 and carboxypeptidase regulatory-like domain-containing protein [Flavobacteriaceae bacterium]|nr:DUF5686 and carboxypeptidase regulatory-like domain-containing protein [Flavobacteriaceae bacterium]